MHRWVLLAALAACGPSSPASGPVDRRASWLIPPGPVGFPLGAVRGRVGRAQAPEPLVDLGIAGPGGLAPLHRAIGVAVPGGGPARAVLFGAEADHLAIDLVDIDAGRLVWRDRTSCAAPVVGATADAIVCAGAGGVRAIGVDGAARWRSDAAFVAFTGDRVVVSDGDAAVVLGASRGEERARIRLPAGVSPAGVIASCGDAGDELYAAGERGQLVRIAARGGAAAVQWKLPFGAILALDACDPETVLVSESGPAGPALVAIARQTGKITGRLEGVRGSWPARDGSGRIEVARALGLASYPRDLAGPPQVLGGPPLGELIASRGAYRLVRATPWTAALLDRSGVRAYLPLAALGAVLGDSALIATSWLGSPSETARRLALPPRWRRALRVPALRRGVAVDAELRDLPPVRALDLAPAIALPDTGTRAVLAPVIDPADGAAVYVVATDHGRAGAAVARADLAVRRWRWQRVDGCGPGEPVGLAVARTVVVCGARGAGATLRATSRDGAAAWEWRGSGSDGGIDGLAAAGDVVVAFDAGRATVLDARDGRVRAHLASDDGAAVRAALVRLGDATLVVTAERGRVVARVGPGGFLPLWSIAVAGVVRALAPSGEGVLVVLEDGDAYRIDARSAQVMPLAGLGLAWQAAGDLVAGQTIGGPIPGPVPAPPPRPLSQVLRRPLQILRGEIDTPPPMSMPIQAPPSLGDSWQLTLYELAGGLRARNDYALMAPVSAPAPRGPPGSPLVVVYGPRQREACVIDPRTGDPLRRVALPDDAAPGAVFATVVDGSPAAGVLLTSPLRVVLF